MDFGKGQSEEGEMEKPTTEAEEHRRSLAAAMTDQLRFYEEKASFPGNEPPASIYRVPPNIRSGDPAAYEPQIISMGPYHHGRPDLQAMEGHKWRYLQDLFRRDPGAEFTEVLEECIERIDKSEARAQRYYSESVDLGRDDFVKMMVLDGCFMLELFLKFYQRERNDPIFAVGWILPLIRCDLLKLENQIPFFVLEILFDTMSVRPSSPELVSPKDLAFIYFKMRRRCAETKKFADVFHLLHFYDLVLMPDAATGDGSAKTSTSPSTLCSSILPIALMLPTRPPAHDGERPRGTVPSIAELSAAGVRFRRKRPAETVLDVSFRHGALEMPTLAVGDDTNSIFRNLIAFEQCSPASGSHFTSYVLFLDGIINGPRDVAALQRCGIIDNRLGSHEEVALLVNQLCKRVTINYRGHYLAPLFEEVNRYCGSNWRRYRARLVHDFFSTPWTIISVYAASALLVLMFVQVVFVVRLYNKS